MKELPVAGLARVGDQVDLGKARDRHISAIGLEMDVVFQARPELRPAEEPFPDLLAVGGEAANHLRRAQAA